MTGLLPGARVERVTRGPALAIDPLARVLPDVHLSEPSSVGSGAVLEGPLRAGPGLRVHPGALVGGPAQHRLGGKRGLLELGAGVEIREAATIHRGSDAGCGVTRIGNRVLVMAYAHIGHDVQLGDDVVLCNGAQLGGHVEVGPGALIAARAALHQFVRVGTGAMVAAGALVSGDVPPWTLVAGDRARIVGVNAHGLRQQGREQSLPLLRRALRLLWPGGGRPALPPIALIEALGGTEAAQDPSIRELIAFLSQPSSRQPCARGRR